MIKATIYTLNGVVELEGDSDEIMEAVEKIQDRNPRITFDVEDYMTDEEMAACFCTGACRQTGICPNSKFNFNI